jgi:hypothetical protein
MSDGAGHTHDHDHAHHHVHATDELAQLGFEAFGVPVTIVAPSDVLLRVEAILPPGSRRREPAEDDQRFVLRPHTRGVYRVEHDGRSVSGSADVQVTLEVLDARLRASIALHAPDHIFVHAGVVGHAGRAIMLPGASFSGKTTLVAALVRAGAAYYSDEFAVLDAEGLVHPYPKPLSIRTEGYSATDHHVDKLGGVAGEYPLRVGLVAVAYYSPDAHWEPRRLSSGEAVLAVLANTVPAQERPEQSLAAIAKAVGGAVAFEGVRGDATGVVDELLAAVAD